MERDILMCDRCWLGEMFRDSRKQWNELPDWIKSNKRQWVKPELCELVRKVPEVPEVFDLQPLETRRVSLRVRDIGPAQFRYIDDFPEDEP